jgi:nucleotide-binding universal stress UspA family protein
MVKILLLVDGSAFTTKAAQYLADHFGVLKGKLELQLLHVTHPVPRAVGVGKLGDGKGLISSFYADEGVAALAPAEEILKKAKLAFTYTHEVGDVGKNVRAFTEKNQIDLLVMGSHGHGALKSLLMGSTATKVLASCKVPVLVVR